MKDTKRELSEFQIIIINLKRTLKKRKVTYAELAEGIGITESGLKKIFSGNDSSIGRISQMCRYLGISLNEVIDDRRTSIIKFSSQQQEDFLLVPNLFNMFWLLVYERLTLNEAQEHLKLSQSDAFKLARRLDSLKLVRLLPNDRVGVPLIKAVRWVPQGKFISKLYNDWSKNLINEVNKSDDNPNDFFVIRYLPMCDKSFEEFKLALLALEDEYAQRSINELQTKPNELQHSRFLIAADRRSFVTGRLRKEVEKLDQ